MNRLLASDLDVDSPVVDVAEALFGELRTFGQMASSRYGIVGDVGGYIRRRAHPTWRLLRVLEEMGALRVEGCLPHSYAVGRWPPDVPIASLADGSAIPRPTSFVEAFVDHWEASSDAMTTYLRLLRSALHVAAHADLCEAVKYLIDLHDAGGAPQEDSVMRVIMELVLARSRSASDREAVEFLLQGPIPNDTAAWTSTLTSLPDIGVRYRIESLSPEARALLTHMLERTRREVHVVRDATDYDSWYTGQLRVCGLISITLMLFGQGLFEERRRPVAIEAALSALEEIEVDGAWRKRNYVRRSVPPRYREDLSALRDAVLASIPSGDDPSDADLQEVLRLPALMLELKYAREEVGAKYRAVFGDAWADELVRRRLLVPAVLGTSALIEPQFAVPAAWERLSWRVAHPYTALFQPSSHPGQVRTSPFSADEVLASNAGLAEGLKESGVKTAGDRARIVALALNLLDVGFDPYAAQEDHPDFGPDLRANLPNLALLSSSTAQTQQLLTAVLRGHINVCYEDVTGALEQINARGLAGDYSEVLSLTKEMLELYPWNDDFLFRRAIALHEVGDSENALAVAVPAAALAPDDGNRWGFLAAMCEVHGITESGAVARQVATVMAQT